LHNYILISKRYATIASPNRSYSTKTQLSSLNKYDQSQPYTKKATAKHGQRPEGRLNI